MTTICANSSHFIGDFSQRFDSAPAMVRKPSLLQLVKAYTVIWYIVLKFERRHGHIIAELRKEFRECQQGCEKAAQCSADFLKLSIQMRDSMLRMHKSIGAVPMLRGAARRVELLEDDWASLVEDLTLASDQEFRNLAKDLSSYL